MMDELIKIAFVDIRKAYHSAVNEWALNDREAMLQFLKEAKEKTTMLIDLLEGEEEKK